jgi:hypothetical protein
MHWLLEVIAEILPPLNRETIYAFCRDYPLGAYVLVFCVVFAVIMFLRSIIIELSHSVSKFTASRSWSGLGLYSVAFGIPIIAVSIVAVSFLVRLFEPVPVLDASQTDFIREPVVLKWTYSRETSEKPVYYEVEVANNPEFDNSDRSIHTDGNSWFSYRHEAANWWRVRAIVDGVRTGPSRALKTSYFKSAYDRIHAEGKLKVYVSNEISLGIFKFLDSSDQLTGIDISLSELIANRLTAEMNKKTTVIFVPIGWNELLEQPGKGTADLIISAISKQEEREQRFQLKFSHPYFCTGFSLLFRPESPHAESSLHDTLKGETVAYGKGTSSEDLINALVDGSSPNSWGKNHLRKKPVSQAKILSKGSLLPIRASTSD